MAEMHKQGECQDKMQREIRVKGPQGTLKTDRNHRKLGERRGAGSLGLGRNQSC